MRSGAHVDPLTRHSPALRSTGRIIRRPPWGRVKLAPIHSVSSWKFSRFSAWLCAGATVVLGFFEFRSVKFVFKTVRLAFRSVDSSSFVCFVVRGETVVFGEAAIFFEGLRCSWVLAQFLEFSPVDR